VLNEEFQMILERGCAPVVTSWWEPMQDELVAMHPPPLHGSKDCLVHVPVFESVTFPELVTGQISQALVAEGVTSSALLAVHTLVPPRQRRPPLNLKFLHRQARGLLFKPSPGCFPSCTLQSAGASSLAGQAECDERASSQRSSCYEIMLATARCRCCTKCAYEETGDCFQTPCRECRFR
jgi:hypothetical protein